MFKKSRILIAVFAIGILGKSVAAQDTLLTVTYKGKLDSIDSDILKQKRYIQVFLPPDYKAGDTVKYDVLYVTDGGNWNISLMTQVQRFIQGEGYMPPTIIVSVMGIDRNIELTPTRLESWGAPTGGAEKFLAFIKNELIPYINKAYPSNGDNTLYGHSLGGMFVVYAMVTEPTLFKSFIAVDPSFWWDNSWVPKLAAAKLPTMPHMDRTLFISSREGPSFHEMKIDTMESILKKMEPNGLKWKLVNYPDETHSSIRLKSMYDGLKFTYAGNTPRIEFTPAKGIILKDKPLTLYYFDDTARVHYTVDGTIPTESSARVQREVTINGPATVTYKRFTNRSRYDKMATGNFIAGEALKAVSKPKDAKPGGLMYSYYEGDANQLQDLKKTKPLKTGIFDKSFDVNSLPRKTNYALVMEGHVEAKQDGYYTFFYRGRTGSKLFLDDKLLMQWNADSSYQVLNYVVPLLKGFHKLRIESFNNKEESALPPYYAAPGSATPGDATPIPFDVEYNNSKH